MRRCSALLLALGILATTAAASLGRCCTLAELSRAASVSSPDCCDGPDCCRAEKRGPAQATLTAKTPEAGPRSALVIPFAAAAPGIAVVHLVAFPRASLPDFDRPPSAALRNTRLLISLYRI